MASMKDSSDSQRPRRLPGLILVGIAAFSLYLSGTTPAVLTEPGRQALLLACALACLVAYTALTPASLSYALMLDLRVRDRQRLQQLGSGGRLWAALLAKARVVDLVLPYVASLYLFCAVWALLAAARAETLGTVATVAFAVAVLLVPMAELLPSRLAGRSPEAAARWSDTVVEGAVTLLGPPLGGAAWVVDRLVHDGIEEAEEREPEADLADVIEVGSHQGDLSIMQSELLRRELDFAAKVAADVMVPRVEVDYLDIDQTFAEAKEHVAAARYSRFPVQSGSVDNVVAVLHVKTLLKYLLGEPPETLRKLLALEVPRKPLEVGEEDPLEDVLEALKRAKSSLAVVKDEYGGVAGILTVEDVVEELVGEIVDESDAEPVTESFNLSGRRLLAELAEHGVELPGEPTQTVAECLAEAFGQPPRLGEQVLVGGWLVTLEALDADGAVESVTLERPVVLAGGG